MVGRASILLLLGICSTPARAEVEVSLRESEPLAVLLVVPAAEVGSTSRSAIIRFVDEILREHTNLDLVETQPEIVNQCRGRLTCLVQRVRPDYERSKLIEPFGATRPYSDHLSWLEQKKVSYTRYLLLFTQLTHADTDNLSALLIDTDKALARYHEAEREEGWELEVEQFIASGALAVPERSSDLADEAATNRFLTTLITKQFRSAFLRTNNWHPFGAIHVVSAPDVVVAVDGKSVGVTTGKMRLVEATARRYKISLSHPEYEPWAASVWVESGETSTVTPSLNRVPGPFSFVSDVVFYSGIAVALVGAGLTVYGATIETPVAYCVRPANGTCPGSPELVRFGVRDSSTVDLLEDGNGQSLPILPVGLGLFGMGTTWSVATLLSDDDVPWIAWIAGVAVFGTVLGISIAADGKNAVAAVKAD